MASKKPVAPVKPGPKAPVVAPGPSKAPVVAPRPPTKLGPNDIQVETWDEAEKQYRTRLQALLADFLRKDVKQALLDQSNTTPLNPIMEYVPVHLLKHAKTGVCEINITVNLMRRAGKLPTDPWKEVIDIGKTPKVQVNLDGWNDTKDRTQHPHIGFNVQNGNEWHVFVTEPMPKGVTGRGALGSAFEPSHTARKEWTKGTALNERWDVTAVTHRRLPPYLSESTGVPDSALPYPLGRA